MKKLRYGTIINLGTEDESEAFVTLEQKWEHFTNEEGEYVSAQQNLHITVDVDDETLFTIEVPDTSEEINIVDDGYCKHGKFVAGMGRDIPCVACEMGDLA